MVDRPCVHQTGVSQSGGPSAILEQGLTANDFIAETRSEQQDDFVTLVSGIHLRSEAKTFPLRLIIGRNALDAANASLMDVPCAMGFQIVLCDVNTVVLIAEGL